jgi:hypothetical protein
MTRGSRGTQRDRILGLFQSRPGQWIGLPEILALGFAQFGARIYELRREGYTIENKTEHRDGKTLSWYRFSGPRSGALKVKVRPAAATLFGDMSPDRSYHE